MSIILYKMEKRRKESFARRKEAEHRETNSANFPLVDDAIMQNTLCGKMWKKNEKKMKKNKREENVTQIPTWNN